MNAAKAWQNRLAQWNAFERWHRDDDPANRVMGVCTSLTDPPQHHPMGART
ncbi:MAG: hypothetical protein AAB152_07175 [Candidatus Coatesbacteria bacterium]